MLHIVILPLLLLIFGTGRERKRVREREREGRREKGRDQYLHNEKKNIFTNSLKDIGMKCLKHSMQAKTGIDSWYATTPLYIHIQTHIIIVA